MPAIMRKVNNISRCMTQFRAANASVLFTPAQTSIVLLVTNKEGLTQEQISRSVCLDKSNTSRALSVLEDGGYIKREVNPENRREVRVFPTEKLEAVIGEVRRVSRLWNELLGEGISEEEVAVFHSVLTRLEARAWELANGGAIK